MAYNVAYGHYLVIVYVYTLQDFTRVEMHYINYAYLNDMLPLKDFLTTSCT